MSVTVAIKKPVGKLKTPNNPKTVSGPKPIGKSGRGTTSAPTPVNLSANGSKMLKPAIAAPMNPKTKGKAGGIPAKSMSALMGYGK